MYWTVNTVLVFLIFLIEYIQYRNNRKNDSESADILRGISFLEQNAKIDNDMLENDESY